MHDQTKVRLLFPVFFLAWSLLAPAGFPSGKAGKGKKAEAQSELLPAAKFSDLKNQPCTFIHVWATWCTVCLQELPDLLKVLAVEKSIRPVVVDVSAPFVQENFSKKWIATLKPSFKTYLKPEGKDDAYLNAIDKDWSGTLPFSVLYHKGQRKKSWLGSIDLTRFKAEVAAACQ